jgi:hypothetical protein
VSGVGVEPQAKGTPSVDVPMSAEHDRHPGPTAPEATVGLHRRPLDDGMHDLIGSE